MRKTSIIGNFVNSNKIDPNLGLFVYPKGKLMSVVHRALGGEVPSFGYSSGTTCPKQSYTGERRYTSWNNDIYSIDSNKTLNKLTFYSL